jgi:hypothetical protein
MPSAGLHRLGRDASRPKFVARPRRESADLQHLIWGRALAQRARSEEGRVRHDDVSLAASDGARVMADYFSGPAAPWAHCRSADTITFQGCFMASFSCLLLGS